MPNKKLTLTIVIPAYNEERYLAACLKSIAGQSVKPDEVIVVDNNSTDGTVQAARRFDFVTILSEPIQGALFARNRGFAAARSDIIARLDADSVLPARWVGRVKQEFASPDTAAVTGPVNGYDLPFPSYNWMAHHLLCWLLQSLPPKHPFLFGFNMALRRDAWQVVRAQVCSDRQTHEDLDLAIHLHKAGHKLKYTRRLLSAASGRRYNDSLDSWRHYMSTYLHTYRRHGYRDWAVYLAAATYWAGYLFYLPWTLRRAARKNPMGI